MRIGLVLNILNEEYQLSVFKGVRNRAFERGIDLICFQQENENFSSDTISALVPSPDFLKLDGIILLTSSLAENLEAHTRADIEKIWTNIPVVSVGQKIQGIPSLLIQSDNAMRELVRHLVQVHGYKSFVFLGGSENHQDAISRKEVFVDTLERLRADFPDLRYKIRQAFFNEVAAQAVIADYYRENPDDRPDVIVCANDNMALGVYKFFQMNSQGGGAEDSDASLNDRASRGAPSPKDAAPWRESGTFCCDRGIIPCAVTGFDDIPQAQFELPPLTTVSQGVEELGEKAVDVLLDVLRGKSVDMDFFLDAGLVIRDSCGCNSLIRSEEKKSRLFRQLQVQYVRSEQMLKLVSRVDQNFNYAKTYKELRSITEDNMNQLGVRNYCILLFNGDYVEPVYVRRNRRALEHFYGRRSMTLCEFYEEYISTDSERTDGLVFKRLYTGGDILGGVFYDAPDENLSYMCTVAVSVSQGLSRIALLEERERRSEQLEKEVQKRTEELVAANNRRMQVEAEVLKISELERQRFSQDLHDDICQRLAGISMLCKSYSNRNSKIERSELEELASLISDTLQTTRRYAHNSYPVELDSLGIDRSIQNLCNTFGLQSGIKCSYSWEVPPEISFTATQRINIFRIVQEALHNVGRHSGADEVSVLLGVEGGMFFLRVCDNGCGLTRADGTLQKGLGLNSMQYRANQIDADFVIRSNTGGGTCVEIKMKI